MKIVLDGIDNVGKSTIVKALRHLNPTAFYHHASAMEKTIAKDFYRGYFSILNADCDFIFDRGHLGEYVYSPLYRDYDGSYVFDMELGLDDKDIKLVLLYSSNLEIIKDDGLSFNYENRSYEQKQFIEAFELSIIENKVMIDVHNGHGGFKELKEIVQEVLK